MGIITQNSRIAHHRLTTSGSIFTIPATTDFTDGSWLITDLTLGEIGINMTDDRIFFRTDNGIVEIATASGLNSLWYRDGEDIRAIENGITSPVIYPNILPPLTQVSDLGSATDAWKDIYISGSVFSDNGPGQLQLDYGNVSGNVMLSNDGSFLGETLYMTPGQISLTTYTSTSRAQTIHNSLTSQYIETIVSDIAPTLPSIVGNYNISYVEESGDISYLIVLPTQIYLGSAVTQGVRNGTVGLNSSVFGGDTSGNEASGVDSFSSGDNNISSGINAFTSGASNTASGNYSASEGISNLSSGYASHSEGASNVSSGNYSHSEGAGNISSGIYSHSEGRFTTASASSTHSGGYGSTSDHFGEWSRSSDQGIKGQYGIMSVYGVTTNATITEIFLDGTSAKFTVASQSAYKVRIYATGIINTGANTGDMAVFSGNGTIKNIGGTTSLLNAIVMTQDEADVSMLASVVTVTADNTTDYLKVEVTGLLAENINWFVRIDYEKISY